MGLDVPLAFAVLVWTVCGVIFSFLAREACRPFTFGRALSVSFWQCLFTVLVAALWQRSINKQQQHHQQHPPSPSHSWAKLAGIAALNLIGLVSTNLSIGMGDVAFAAVIKATEPCFLFVLKLFLGHEFEDRGVLFIVAAVLGTGLMSWDNSFSLSALFLGLTANCCYSSVNYFLSTERANVARHLVVFFGLAAPCVLFAQFFVGSDLFDAPTVTYAVSAGVVFGVYRVVSGWVVTRIDVILHALLNLAKRAAVIVVFALAYNRHLSLTSWTGAFVTFSSAMFFSLRAVGTVAFWRNALGYVLILACLMAAATFVRPEHPPAVAKGLAANRFLKPDIHVLVRMHGLEEAQVFKACEMFISSVNAVSPDSKVVLWGNLNWTKMTKLSKSVQTRPLNALEILRHTPARHIVERHAELKWTAMTTWDSFMETALVLGIAAQFPSAFVLSQPQVLLRPLPTQPLPFVLGAGALLAGSRDVAVSGLEKLVENFDPKESPRLLQDVVAVAADAVVDDDGDYLKAFQPPVKRSLFGILDYVTFNVGDWVQSYAALQYLPFVDVKLNRDHLVASCSKFSQDVVVIMNGWWQHSANWPPPGNLIPVPVSMHIAKPFVMFTEAGLQWFRKHAPIYARDLGTLRHLRSQGIEARFGGCLTMTIRPTQNYRRTRDGRGIVVALDQMDEVLANFSSLRTRPDIVVVRAVGSAFPEGGSSFPENHKEQKDELWRGAVHNLRIFEMADLVITDRLHVALPGSAVGANVVFLDRKLSNGRFDGLLAPAKEVPGQRLPESPMGVKVLNQSQYHLLELIAKRQWPDRSFVANQGRLAVIRATKARIQSNELLRRSGSEYGLFSDEKKTSA